MPTLHNTTSSLSIAQRAAAAATAAFLTLVMLVGVNALATAEHHDARLAQVAAPSGVRG